MPRVLATYHLDVANRRNAAHKEIYSHDGRPICGEMDTRHKRVNNQIEHWFTLGLCSLGGDL